MQYLAGLSDVTRAPLQNLASTVGGAFGESGGVTVNIQVSGVLDPRTIQDLSKGVRRRDDETGRIPADHSGHETNRAAA